jgi:deoxyribodipyrimidine photolyase-related protein
MVSDLLYTYKTLALPACTDLGGFVEFAYWSSSEGGLNIAWAQQYFGLKRLSDLPELKERAKQVLHGLESGEI